MYLFLSTQGHVQHIQTIVCGYIQYTYKMKTVSMAYVYFYDFLCFKRMSTFASNILLVTLLSFSIYQPSPVKEHDLLESKNRPSWNNSKKAVEVSVLAIQ